MKQINNKQINTPEYWNEIERSTARDFGLRQKKYIEFAGKGESIIELGCGLSPMLHYASNFKRKVGLDFSDVVIKTARELYDNVEYVVGDCTNTKFADKTFDAVVAGELIEHLEKPEALIKEMSRICKDGGTIIISTPKLEFNDPEHLWEFNGEDFRKWGFRVEIVKSDRFKGRKYIFAICKK
jgi:ubiquinone/menaquinone biosynthesis C-methylase UbiE